MAVLLVVRGDWRRRPYLNRAERPVLPSIAARSRPCRVRTVEDRFVVTCPYCGEEVEIYVEPDTEGT
ncbi:MAG TPA: hypothetical protein VMS86_13245, partial [Thermoanaerobaculia bacterium]|nr:hypothetical protein [Thermoanaerobaculia bacterium]